MQYDSSTRVKNGEVWAGRNYYYKVSSPPAEPRLRVTFSPADSQRVKQTGEGGGGRRRAGSRVDSHRNLPPHAPTFRCTLSPLRASDSNVPTTDYLRSPSLKGYQIGRELLRTLTQRLREGLGPGGRRKAEPVSSREAAKHPPIALLPQDALLGRTPKTLRFGPSRRQSPRASPPASP